MKKEVPNELTKEMVLKFAANIRSKSSADLAALSAFTKVEIEMMTHHFRQMQRKASPDSELFKKLPKMEARISMAHIQRELIECELRQQMRELEGSEVSEPYWAIKVFNQAMEDEE